MYTRLIDFDTMGCDPMFFKYTYEQEEQPYTGDNYRSNFTPWALPAEPWKKQPDIPLKGQARISRFLTIMQNGHGNAARELRVAGLGRDGAPGYYVKQIDDAEWRFVRAPLSIREQDFLTPAPETDPQDTATPVVVQPAPRAEPTDFAYTGYAVKNGVNLSGIRCEVDGFSLASEGQASLRLRFAGNSTENPQETETIERLDPAIAAKDSANVSESSSDSGSGVSRQLKEMAANGDAKTQYELGHQYAINNDFDEAAKWYTKAANQGCGEAQGELAMFYLDGRGVEKDETQAAYWIKQWAAQGDALGQLWLGKFYYNGIGVGQDFTTAVLWFEKSAEQGNMDAIFSLGLCHYEGKGTVKDYNKAFSLFQRAANVNDPNQVSTSAMIYLSKCYANGQGTTKDMNKAHQWMERAAQMGDADAQEALQEM